MALQLKLDPKPLEAGAAQAKTALDGIKAAAVQAESAIDQVGKGAAFAPLTTGAAQAATAATLMGREVAAIGAGSGRTASQVQNAAFQIGDFAVQVAGGTSAMRAMTQQLPQLLGGFGVWGAVLGGVAAVAGALVPMLFNMGDGASNAGDQLDTLSSALSDFNKNAKIGATAVEDLRAQYGQWAGEIQATAQWIAQVNVGQAVDTLSQKTLTFSTALDAVAQAQGNVRESEAAWKRAQDQLTRGVIDDELAVRNLFEAYLQAGVNADDAAKAIGLTTDQATKLNSAFDAMHGAKTMQDIHDRATEALQTLHDMFPAGEALPKAFGDAAIALEEVQRQSAAGLVTMQDMPGALNSATSAAGGLAGAMGQVSMAANAAMSQMIQMDATRRAMQSAAQGQAAAPHGIGPAGMGDGSTAYASGAARAQAEAEAAKLRELAAKPFVMPHGSGGGGGGGGGGASAIDQTKAAYDSLITSLDPVVAKTQDMAKATATADAALAHHDITAAEHAHAMDLIRQKYEDVGGAAQALKDVGGNALDSLIDGTKNLSEALKQMAKDLIFATLKAELLKHVTGGTSGMSIGSLIISGITGGFHDTGGTIPQGTTGMVGERGPELVTAGRNGAVVTSRVDTARMMQAVTSAGTAPQRAQAQAIRVSVDVGVTVDDDGKMQAYVRKVGHAAASAGASQAVQSVKRSLSTWNTQLATDGALA